MKKLLILILLFLGGVAHLIAQKTNKNVLGIEVHPIVASQYLGTGLQINYTRKMKKNFFVSFNYGIIYDYYDQGTYSIPKYAINGAPLKPIAVHTTEVKANDPNAGNYSIPLKILVDDYKNSGFKQLEPYASSRLDHFGSINLGYTFLSKKKWNINVSVGGLLGLANITTAAGALNQTISNPFFSSTDTWVVFQLRAKFYYVGLSTKIDIDRIINDRLSIGITNGLNYSINNIDLREENKIYYVGVSAKINF